ncbi:HAD-IA family hydrolase [Nocardia sp. NPDC052566]|uniref:HAD-IA family hydrolase n=1 Tax=Nocardia sp. NPDC052566 TaxID=3364330 RepID=UPI0037CC0999
MDIEVRCAALLFDCDGVVVDSTDSGEQAWRQWATEYGLDPEQVLVGIHGRRSADTVRLFLPEEAHAEGLARIETIEIAGAVGTSPIPGALELLNRLADNWAIVTSASPALLTARLTAAGLPLPPVTITAADVTAGKPAPDGYLLAAHKLSTPITDCVVLEDSTTGIAAGLAAAPHRVIGVGAHALTTDAPVVIRDLTGASPTPTGIHFPATSVLRPS